MSFPGDLALLAPGFLGVAALALLVILLHRQHSRKAMPVPSLILWSRLASTQQRAALSRRLPRISLPLLLQIAIICLIAMALARPVLGPGAGEPAHHIYVLDSSSSMRLPSGATSRFEAARTELSRRLRGELDRDAPRVSLIAADSAPALVFARQPYDRDRLAGLGDRLAPTDSEADWPAVGRLIESVRREGERTEIFALTDAADPAVAELGATVLPVGQQVPATALAVTLKEIAGEQPNRFRLTGRVERFGGAGEVTLVASFDTPSAPAPLELARSVLSIPETAAGAESASVPVDIELTIPGGGVLAVSVEGDDWPGQSSARFVLRAAAESIDILLVGGSDPVLLNGLQSLPHAVVQHAESLPEDVSGIDLVVLDNVVVPRAPETNTMWVGRARLAGEPDPPALEPGEVTDWDPLHPLSRGIVWRNLAVTRASKLTPWADGDVVVAAGENVLVEARSTPHGREVRIAPDPERAWGAETSFPQLLGNLVAWLGPSPAGRVVEPCIAGRPCLLDARWYGRPMARLSEDRSIAAAEAEFMLPAPEGNFVPDRAGLYRVAGSLVAVNAGRDAAEPGIVPDSPAPAAPLRLWPFLVGGAVLLLLVEAVVVLRRRSAPRWLPAARALVVAALVAALFAAPAPGLTEASPSVAIAGGDDDDDLALRLVQERQGEPAASAMLRVGDAIAVDRDFGEPPGEDATAPGVEGSAADAVRLAAALLPEGRGRVLLATPLAFSPADVAGLAGELKGRGIALDMAAPVAMPAGEVGVTDLRVPPMVLRDDSFPLNAVLRAGSAGTAHLELLAGGESIAERDVELVAGDNPVEFTVPKIDDEETLYEISVSAAGDVHPENNRDGVVVAMAPPPAVLVLSADRAAGLAFVEGLAKHGFEARMLVPTAAPWLIEDWLAYDGYVLLDVPSLSMKTTQQALLESAVAEHGRALLMMGGPHSFGPGGYLQTTLDRLSPLSSRVPKPAPEAAMVFVIDRSGSMAQLVDDVDRLEIAKQAVLSAIGLLNPLSRVGVIAFDTIPHEIVPLTPAADVGAIAAAMRPLGPGGGTELRPALEAAVAQLRGVDAPVKHIVALTDGLTPPADFAPIIAEMNAAGISVSTIAIGTDSNDKVLRNIAQAGHGVFHGSTDFKALPSIMTQETMLLSDSAIEEFEVAPQWRPPRSDFLASLPDSLPAIEGYVLTTEKPEAKVDLTIRTQDGGESPLLASWRFGSGQVLALATQDNGPWTGRLAGLESYGDLWPEVLRHFVSGAERQGLSLRVARQGDTAFVTVSALDRKRAPLSGLDLGVTATGAPGRKGETVKLVEMRPGLYEGSLVLGMPGDYRLEVTGGDAAASARMHVGYAARFAFSPDRSGQALAGATGGRIIAAGEPLLERSTARLAWAPDWLFWAIAAVILFMLELLLRYGGGLYNRPAWGRTAPRPRDAAAPGGVAG